MTYPSFKDKQQTLFFRAKELREKATPAELSFKSKLELLGIKHIFQKSFIQGDFYCICDFYLPKPFKTVIEIDGEYHNIPTQKKKDFAKDMYLTNTRGFKVLRISNAQAISISTEDLAELLKSKKPELNKKPGLRWIVE